MQNTQKRTRTHTHAHAEQMTLPFALRKWLLSWPRRVGGSRGGGREVQAAELTSWDFFSPYFQQIPPALFRSAFWFCSMTWRKVCGQRRFGGPEGGDLGPELVSLTVKVAYTWAHGSRSVWPHRVCVRRRADTPGVQGNLDPFFLPYCDFASLHDCVIYRQQCRGACLAAVEM